MIVSISISKKVSPGGNQALVFVNTKVYVTKILFDNKFFPKL